MSGVEDRSEFEGGGVMPNTVFPKGTEALTNGDKLRLMSITGQETDSRAPVDPYFWQGNVPPDPNEERIVRRQRQQADRVRKQEERGRYRESRG